MEASAPKPIDTSELEATLARYWWLPLIAGIAWLGIAYVVLQFDEASIKTVGVLVGLMFLFSGLQQFALAAFADRGRWLFVIFGFLFLVGGVITLISPEETFAGIADILGFVFLLVGLFWVIQALGSRPYNELWLLGLMSGVLMLILAFWTSGQFFMEKQYTLLVFAGIWALMHAFNDLIQAFQLRKLKP